MSSASSASSASAASLNASSSSLISVRLLTGEVLPISVPAEISYAALYQLIRSELPQEIRPPFLDQMNLMGGGELVPNGLEKAVLSDQEYVLLIDAERYYLHLGFYHSRITVMDRVLLNGLIHWDRADYIPVHVCMERSVGKVAELVMEEWHLYDFHTRRFLDLTGIPLEWVRDDTDENNDEGDKTLRLRIPHERHNMSMEEMEAFLLQRIHTLVQPSLAGIRSLASRIHKGLEDVDEEWGAWNDSDLDEDGIPHDLPEDFEAEDFEA